MINPKYQIMNQQDTRVASNYCSMIGSYHLSSRNTTKIQPRRRGLRYKLANGILLTRESPQWGRR